MSYTSYLARIETLLEHIHAYYVLHAPTITDAEYDALYTELVQIETEHPEWIASTSPTQSLIGQQETTQS